MSPRLTKAQKAILDALHKAERSLLDYRDIVLDNREAKQFSYASFHRTWNDSLLFGKGNEAWEAFRGSGKSQLVLRSFPLYKLSYPDIGCNYIVLIKENATQATKTLKGITREHQDKNNLLPSSNLVEVIEESGEAYQVKCLNRKGQEIEVRIEAYGKGQAIRGCMWKAKRPDIVIIDDPQSREDARSETMLENDWQWFLSDVKFLGGSGSRIFLIGNNLGQRCIIERVMQNPEVLNFRCSRIPRMQNGFVSWPECGDTIEKIEEMKAGFAHLGQLNIFYEEVLCQSLAEEERTFKDEDYRFYSPSIVSNLAGKLNVCAVLDPASSKAVNSCYRAIPIVGVDERNNWFVLDCLFGRWDSVETLNYIFDTVKKWRLNSFGIEKGHYEQVIKPFLMQEMGKRNCFFNVIPLEHAKIGTKLERIKMLQPRFKAHTIWFPESAPWLSEMKSELAGVTKDSIKSEYIDLVDALAMVEQVASAPHGVEPDLVEFHETVMPMYSPFSR